MKVMHVVNSLEPGVAAGKEHAMAKINGAQI